MGSRNSFGKGKLRRKPLQSSNQATAKLCETEVRILFLLVECHGCRDDWKGLWIVLSWVIILAEEPHCAAEHQVSAAGLVQPNSALKIWVNNLLSSTALISATYYKMRWYQCRNFLQLLHTNHHLTWMLSIIRLCKRLI